MARAPQQRKFNVGRFSADVLDAIKRRGLTHEQAADQCGVYKELFSKMRRSGQTPSVDAFLAICQWAGFDPLAYISAEKAPSVRNHFAGLVR